MRLKFLKPILILTIILVALLAYPMAVWLVEVRPSVIAALAIAVGNAIIGMFIIELTLDKPNFIFMAAFFGGMGIRIFIILFVFALLLSEGFDGMALTFFLMGCYFVYMVVEIRYLIKVLANQKNYQRRR